MLNKFYADLHIHVGMSDLGKWVKVSTSPQLTVANILREAYEDKGLDMIGLADALSPLVLNDLEKLAGEGLISELAGGGYSYQGKLSLILGAEIETVEDSGRCSHTLIFLPYLQTMRAFSNVMSNYIRNINLSSQNAHIPLRQLVKIAADFEALIVPAHVFTPFKGLYGSCCSSLAELMPEKYFSHLSAIELGLSADSDLADRIGELNQFSFLSNSDAHSLIKIAREYNVLELNRPDFSEFAKALLRKEGRKIFRNYGLDPRLGKYHRSFCAKCGNINAGALTDECPVCNGRTMVTGVLERTGAISDYDIPNHPGFRPPYNYQIPLEFIPGLGPRSRQRLIERFGSEMNVLHRATGRDIALLLGDKLADRIVKARSGQLSIAAGGGGLYGKLKL